VLYKLTLYLLTYLLTFRNLIDCSVTAFLEFRLNMASVTTKTVRTLLPVICVIHHRISTEGAETGS